MKAQTPGRDPRGFTLIEVLVIMSANVRDSVDRLCLVIGPPVRWRRGMT
jgi:hypothetical protein